MSFPTSSPKAANEDSWPMICEDNLSLSAREALIVSWMEHAPLGSTRGKNRLFQCFYLSQPDIFVCGVIGFKIFLTPPNEKRADTINGISP